MKHRLLTELPTFDSETGDLYVIIETPGGSRNKFDYYPDHDVIKFGKSLPAGAVFPREFGFIPSTLGEDGDPLDVLLFMDAPTYPGVLATARLIGVIEAEQSEEGKTVRNDRLIAVASKSQDYCNVKTLADLDANMVTQLEHFFVSYNQIEGKEFKPLGRGSAERARKLVDEGRHLFVSKHKK